MGFDLKDKKKVCAISVLVVLIAVLVGAICFENYHIKQVKAQREKIRQERIAAEQQQQPDKRPSDYAVGKDFNSVAKSGKPVFTLFYADWCRYCIKFMPVFEEIANKYGKEIEFAKVNVEDPKYKPLVDEHKISGFPTVIIIDKKYDNKVIVPNSSMGNIEDLSAEVERFVKIRRLLDKK